MALERDLKVLTEVGKKDNKVKVSIESLIEQVHKDLETGAYKVIMEGRESGKNIGLYDEKGKLIENKYEQFSSKLVNPDDIIWEAPLKDQQFDFIVKMGSDVNLGNIATSEVLALEALRTGLRGDTLNLVVSYEKIKEQEMHPVLRKFSGRSIKGASLSYISWKVGMLKSWKGTDASSRTNNYKNNSQFSTLNFN